VILRDYQQQIVSDAQVSLPLHKTGLVTMATGLGKTVTAVAIAQAVSKRRVLWLTHLDILAQQAVSAFEAMSDLTVGLEMNVYQVDPFDMPDVIVSTVQSMITRLDKFSPSDFDLIIADESHHAVSATWLSCIGHFRSNPGLMVLGLTATPDRHDKKALGKVFNTVICNLDIKWGIDNGWLVPIKERHIHIESMDISRVKTVNGDLNQKELSEIVENHDVLYEVAVKLPEIAAGRQGIVYCRTVRQSHLLTEVLKYSYDTPCATISGKIVGDQRTEMLNSFRTKELQHLLNVGVLIEGVDAPWVEIVVITSPTKSRAKYTQEVGRGTRPLPGGVDGLRTAQE